MSEQLTVLFFILQFRKRPFSYLQSGLDVYARSLKGGMPSCGTVANLPWPCNRHFTHRSEQHLQTGAPFALLASTQGPFSIRSAVSRIEFSGSRFLYGHYAHRGSIASSTDIYSFVMVLDLSNGLSDLWHSVDIQSKYTWY